MKVLFVIIKKPSVLISLLLFTIAFIWKLFYITERPLCLDEPYTLFHAQQGFWHILELSIQKEPTPPLFMLLVGLMYKIVGLSTFGLRLLPLFFNALTAVILFRIGQKISSTATGILTSSLFILSSYHFYFALELRTYSLTSFGTALSILQLIVLIKQSSNKAFWLLILANLILVFSNYFGWLIIGVNTLSASVLFLKNKALIKRIWLSTLTSLLFFGPFIYFMLVRFFKASEGTWVPAPTKKMFKAEIFAFLNSEVVLWMALIFFLIGITFYFLKLSIARVTQTINLKILFIGIICFFLPFSFMFLISSEIPMFINRYILFCSIPLYISISIMAIGFFKQANVQFILAFILISASFIHLKILPQQFYFRDIERAVSHAKRENSLYLIYPKWTEINFAYHFDKTIFTDYNNFSNALHDKNVYSVYGLSEVKSAIQKNKTKQITLFVNGNSQTKECIEIRNYLNKHFTRTDSSHFEQTFYINQYQLP